MNFRKVAGFCVFLVVIFIGFSFGEDGFWNQKYGSLLTYESVYFIDNGEVRLYVMTPEGYRLETVSPETLKPGEDGYYRTELFGGNQIFLFGGNYVFLAEQGKEDYSVYNPGVSLTKLIEKGAFKQKTFGIKGVISDTFLSEGSGKNKIEYTAEDLNNVFYTGWLGLRWNDLLTPWAEGRSGPGIGAELTIEFTEPKDHVLIINGFVDFGRPHLYKANNRVKTCRIRSADDDEYFEVKGEFEDAVRLHEFCFPRPADKIILKILEVYPGRRWDDTVVTGILTRDPQDAFDLLSPQVKSALPY